MSDIRPLTKQEIFDKVYTHFIIEKNPISIENGTCRYRTDRGDRCAIGLFIPEHEYTHELEYNPISLIFNRIPETSFLLNVEENAAFLEELQLAHDGYANLAITEMINGKDFSSAGSHSIKIRMRNLASAYELTIPGEDNE